MIKSLYRRYHHIKSRCYNKNDKSFKNYGGRGIAMCSEWLNNYSAFEEWCLSHGYAEGLAIDRIDNNGDYSPQNCRFVTLKENNQNRRSTRFYTINGVRKNLQQWCDFYGIKRGTVEARLKHGASIEDALTRPVANHYRDRTKNIGKRFGRLIVIAYAGDEYIGSDNNSRWVCKCDCGKTAVVGDWKLNSGHTKSCGCLVNEKARERMIRHNPMKKKKGKE